MKVIVYTQNPYTFFAVKYSAALSELITELQTLSRITKGLTDFTVHSSSLNIMKIAYTSRFTTLMQANANVNPIYRH